MLQLGVVFDAFQYFVPILFGKIDIQQNEIRKIFGALLYDGHQKIQCLASVSEDLELIGDFSFLQGFGSQQNISFVVFDQQDFDGVLTHVF